MNILGLLNTVFSFLAKWLPVLFAYKKGKDDNAAENTKEELERAREAQEVWEEVSHTDPNTLRERLRQRVSRGKDLNDKE